MIEVYILSSTCKEIEDKNYLSITDEEFKILGKKYTIEELQYGLNNPDLIDFNFSNDWIRFIEEPFDVIKAFAAEIRPGFTIYFMKDPFMPKDRGYLILHADNMPKKDE